MLTEGPSCVSAAGAEDIGRADVPALIMAMRKMTDVESMVDELGWVV